MKISIIISIEIIIIIAALILGGMYFYKSIDKTPAQTTTKVQGANSSASTKNATSSTPNYSNLISNLPKNQMIKDLPEGKSLYFQTFSFPSGQRVWEKSFVIGKGTMKEGTLENPEVTLTIHSKYVNQINSTNLCDVLRTANKNKDLGFESDLDYISLAWKYSSLMKYKSCFS